MDDLEEPTFLRTAINEVLPELPEMTKNILEESLQSLGVEKLEDLTFLEEADLLSSLRPIQARKVLAAWKMRYQSPGTSSSSEEVTPRPYERLPSPSPTSSSSSISCQSPDVNWADSYDIPWNKLPQELMDSLEREKRPSSRMRRAMVRIVVDDMARKSSCLSRRHSTAVSKKIVAKYPKSFKDVIEGDVIGTGYDSLVKQIQYRVENVKRPGPPKIMKRKNHTDSDTDLISPEKRAEIQDTYGCVRFDVKYLPLGESPESQNEKKEKMKMMAMENAANPGIVKNLMKMTYYSQRKDVNQGNDVQYLHREWPLLFHEVGMSIHFKELTGNELKEGFVRNIDQKGKRLLHYMNTVCKYKCKRFLEDLTKYKVLRGQLSGCSEDTKDMVLLLLSYFEEREDVLFSYVDQTCLAGEVPMEQVPMTPTIIVCGQSCYSADRFMLSVDRMIVQDNVGSFVSAISMMFGSYYCLNVHYPIQLASTLEFLQRCFFSINPEKGTKVEKSKTKRLNVNPRVLTLIQGLSDHEWCNV